MSEFERWYKPLTFPLFGLTKERDQFLFEAGKQAAQHRKCVWTVLDKKNLANYSTSCGRLICGNKTNYCDECGGEVEIKEAQ